MNAPTVILPYVNTKDNHKTEFLRGYRRVDFARRRRLFRFDPLRFGVIVQYVVTPSCSKDSLRSRRLQMSLMSQ